MDRLLRRTRALGRILGIVTSAASTPSLADATQRRLVSAYNDFGFALFREAVAAEPQKSVFVSPFGVGLALTMTYNGAAADTQQAMARTLRFQGLDLAQVNAACHALQRGLESADSATELVIANSLWARQGFSFNRDFLRRNRTVFDAMISALDFSSPEASATINRWVRSRTGSKIAEIVPERINPLTVLFLINAVYFKGMWASPFDPARTVGRRFHLLDGRQKNVPMMAQRARVPYYRARGFQAVSLPYGDGRMSMDIFVPDEDSSLQALIGSLDAKTWEAWSWRFVPREGDIALPRFRLEYGITLNAALEAMGMGIAFDSHRADLSGMLPDPRVADLYISRVEHKTFVEVTEEGTEAAGAASVEIASRSVGLTERFSFVADRPFLFVIRDNDLDIVLFVGALLDPT